ncbi:MAG: response regulator, partial [Bacteroidota bacterium]
AMWIAGSRGRLYLADAEGLTRVATLPARQVEQVLAFGGWLWAVAESGLFRIDPASGAVRQFDDPVLLQAPRTLFAEPRGWLWIGTAAGFVLFDTASERVLTVRSNAPGNAIALPTATPTDVLFDRSGIFWVATGGAGVASADFLTSRFPVYQARPGDSASLASSSLRAIASDSASIWAGLNDAGLNRIDRETGRVTRFPLPAPPAGVSWPDTGIRTVYGLDRDRSGRLWSVVNWGVRRHDASGRVVAEYAFPTPAVAAINPAFVHEDEAGRFWVGARQLQSLDLASGTFTVVPDIPDAVAIHETADGALWIASGVGLVRYDPTTGEREIFGHDPEDSGSLSSDATVSMVADGDSVLWVGTVAGLNRFSLRTRRAERYTSANSGLPNNYINGVLLSETGDVWVSTNDGLARLDPEAGTFTLLNEARGLQSPEFNRGAYHRAADGTLMFGGIDGLNVFDPAALRENPHPPEVRLRRVVVAPRRQVQEVVSGPGIVETGGLVRLGPDARDLRIDYVGLHYADPSANRYRVWLEGYDDGWGAVTDDRVAYYTNLDPGTYRFHVRAANAYGVWSDDVILATIEVAPHWWETTWFRLLVLLAGLGTVFGVYRWRTHEARHRERQLRVEVASRTRDLARETARAERHAEDAERHAEELERLNQGQRDLFANVSHETRTPLTLILGPVEDLLAEDDLPADLRTTLEGVRRNGRRLLHLVDQILDLARMEAGQAELRLQRVDVGEVVGTLAEAFKDYAQRRGVQLTCDTPQDPLVGDFDVALIEHILLNLTSNAIKFTPAGGKVLVTAYTDDGGKSAVIRVNDTGVGIHPDLFGDLFDRFSLAHADGESSTGLGLAIVKEAAELHGGTVKVQSRVGFGAQFTVRLPVRDGGVSEGASGDSYQPGMLLPDLAAAERPAAPDPSGPVPDRTTVLVVEDSTDARAYVASILRPAYRVYEAPNGAAGLEVARRHLPDLIVSDVAMPEMDGLAMLRALRTDPELSTTPVVLLTARVEVEDRLAGLKAGADDYLAKPFDARELRARVANLISARRAWRLAESPLPVVRDAFPDALSADDELRQRVEEAVHRQFSDGEFSASGLATAVGLSGSQLRRRTQDLFGKTPTEIIRGYRLAQAARQLEKRTGTVAEVAYAVGFNSVSYFTRSFVDAYGVTPTAYAEAAA